MRQLRVLVRLCDFVENNFAGSLFAVFLFGVTARLLYVSFVVPHILMGFDAAWYVTEGHALLQGHGYVEPRVFLSTGQFLPTANFPPLWPAVLAIANWAGLDSSTASRYVGVGIGSLTVVVTGLTGRRIASPFVGVVAAILVAVNPMLIAADGSLMSESLYVLLIITVVFLVIRALERPQWVHFGVAGLVLGLAALTRSDAVIFLAVLVVALWWSLRVVPFQQRLGYVLVLLATFSIPFGAWAWSRSSQMGGLVLATSNSGNLLTVSNCNGTYYGSRLGAIDEACASNLRPGENEREWAATSRARALGYAREHWTRTPVVATARMARVWGFWSPQPQARLEELETRNYHWQLIGWGFDIILVLAAFPGFIDLYRKRKTIVPLVAVIIGVTVTAAISNGNHRFRLAADPVVAICAAVGIALLTCGRAAHRHFCELGSVGQKSSEAEFMQ